MSRCSRVKDASVGCTRDRATAPRSSKRRVAAHGDTAWVRTRDQTVDEGWFGPHVSADALARLGDVALVAREDVAFVEPTDTGPFDLIGRHGSATAAEIRVPLLVGVAS